MDLKEVILVRIKIDEKQQEQIIILKEKEGDRHIPIVIGMAEVNAIKMKLSGIEPPRPLTHDLLLDVAQKFNSKLARVLINELESSTFFAKIIFSQNGENGNEITVDARPSDGIALALRADAPIYCSEEILEAAAIQG